MTIRADLDHLTARKRRRRVAVLATLGAVLSLTLLLAGVWIWRLALSGLPPTPDGPGLANHNRPPSVIFLDRRGAEIGRRGPGGGEVLRLADLPPFVPQAFLAAEDRRFHSHFGVDLIGVARSVRTNLKAGRVVEGGSTITQQIARTLFLSPEQTLRRKAQEAVLAVRIEQRMGKDDILKLYLNRIYFGAGAYGIEAASRTYFGKPARNLTLSEAALLAALPKAPTRLDPTNNFSAALRRSRLVLSRMEGEGWIDAAAAAAARAAPPTLAEEPEREEAFGYVLDLAAAQVKAMAPSDAPELVVRLSVDGALQRQAQLTVREAVAANIDRGAEQAALVALGPDGSILALAGGVDHRDSPFDRAVQARRQPGSAFKPFVYAAALESGVQPDDIRRDAPVRYGDWSPRNAGGTYAGDVTVDEALTRSINTVAVKLAEEAGPERVAKLARGFGLGTIPPRPELSVALGAYEVTLLDLVSAYQVFQQKGLRQKPHLVEELATPEGRILWRRPAIAPIQVYDHLRSGQMTAMMQHVIDGGPGSRADLGRPAAGKTGTTQNNRDAWFVGFTPDLVAGVWVGNDPARPMRGVTGADVPALMWRQFMLVAHEGLPERGFETTAAQAADDDRAAFYKDLAAELEAAAAGET
jgi:penicillin-binding protein 1A